MTIEEMNIISHLDRPALSLRIKRPDAQPLTHIYEFDELPITPKALAERLKWIASQLEEDYC